MSALFGTIPCTDPEQLRQACIDRDLPNDWYGRPNTFRLSLGREPGSGWILLTKSDLDDLDLNADHTLRFLDDQDTSIELRRITLLRAVCIAPGFEDDPALDEVFLALAHPLRRRALLLLRFRQGSLTAGEIARRFACSWPTVTRHLRTLESAGIVRVEPRGRERVYHLNHERLKGTAGGWLRWLE